MGKLSVIKIAKHLKFITQSLCRPDPKMIYVGGWHGHNNLGDEALYISLQTLFSTFKFLDFESGLESGICKKIIKKTGRSILGGGTTIGYRRSTINKIEYVFGNSASNVVFGSGVNDISFFKKHVDSAAIKEAASRWCDMLNACAYVGVRGPLSKAILNEWGVRNVEVIGDPVLSLADDSCPDPVSTEDKIIGINICDLDLIWGSKEKYIEDVIEFSKLARRNNWKIKWFVVYPKDLKLTKYIARETETEEEIYKIYHDPLAFKDIVKKVNVFIGTKLHAVILSLCSYTPSLMLEYQPKCLDFMKSIDMEKMTIRTDRIAADSMVQTIEEIRHNTKAYSSDIFKNIQTLKQQQILKAKGIEKKLLSQSDK